MDYAKYIFDKLNVKPYEEFKLEGEDLLYRLDEQLNVEGKFTSIGWSRSAHTIQSILNGTYSIIKFPSKEDQIVIDYAKLCGYKYIAKDKNGDVCMYQEKPIKHYTQWVAMGGLKPILHPISLVSWEDEEPYYIGD